VSPAEVVAFLGRQLLLWAAYRLHPSGVEHLDRDQAGLAATARHLAEVFALGPCLWPATEASTEPTAAPGLNTNQPTRDPTLRRRRPDGRAPGLRPSSRPAPVRRHRSGRSAHDCQAGPSQRGARRFAWVTPKLERWSPSVTPTGPVVTRYPPFGTASANGGSVVVTLLIRMFCVTDAYARRVPCWRRRMRRAWTTWRNPDSPDRGHVLCGIGFGISQAVTFALLMIMRSSPATAQPAPCGTGPTTPGTRPVPSCSPCSWPAPALWRPSPSPGCWCLPAGVTAAERTW